MGNGMARSTQKELLGVIVFAGISTFIMVLLNAFERLYLFANMLSPFQFGEFAVFFPAFLALGFTYFSYRRIRELELEVVKRKEVEEALRDSEQRYKSLSITDELTKLHNRRHFDVCLTLEINRADRYGHPLSLLMLDIDNFKKFNDRFGHLEGNKVLVILGRTITACKRQSDTAFRYGGEEFMVILPESNIKGALKAAERIREGFEAEAVSPEQHPMIHNTVSIGVTQYVPGEDPESLVHRADTAMYAAKRQGKNRVVPSPAD